MKKEDIPSPPPPPPSPSKVGGIVPRTKDTFEPIKLHFAINKGDYDEVKKEVARKLNINFIIHGNTPLILAIVKEHYEIAKLLIKSGADLSCREKFKLERQAIHVACKMGPLDVVKCLVQYGASLQSCDYDGNTALNIAAYEGSSDIVDFLCQSGAHINVKDGRGKTALFNAVENNHIQTFMLLLNLGALVNVHDNFGWTPLIHCVVCGYLDLANRLIDNGANVDGQDRNGEMPIHFACGRLRGVHLRCLCKNNIDFYTRHLKVVTPVIVKAIDSPIVGLQFVKLLVDAGCSINAISGFGQTPIGLSLEEGNTEIFEYLFQAGCDISRDFNYEHGSILWADGNTSPYKEHFKNHLSTVRTLQDSCKLKIRNQLGKVCISVGSNLTGRVSKKISSNIQNLPLPERIKDFLQL